MALAVVGSAEAQEVLARGYYGTNLFRPADPAGLAFWVEQLQQGQREEAILAGILSSGEFFSAG